MERAQRKEITLEQANGIAEEIERLEYILSQIRQSDYIQLFFIKKGYGAEGEKTKYKSKNLSLEYAEKYTEVVKSKLDEVKKERENSILIDW